MLQQIYEAILLPYILCRPSQPAQYQYRGPNIVKILHIFIGNNHWSQPAQYQYIRPNIIKILSLQRVLYSLSQSLIKALSILSYIHSYLPLPLYKIYINLTIKALQQRLLTIGVEGRRQLQRRHRSLLQNQYRSLLQNQHKSQISRVLEQRYSLERSSLLNLQYIYYSNLSSLSLLLPAFFFYLYLFSLLLLTLIFFLLYLSSFLLYLFLYLLLLLSLLGLISFYKRTHMPQGRLKSSL